MLHRCQHNFKLLKVFFIYLQRENFCTRQKSFSGVVIDFVLNGMNRRIHVFHACLGIEQEVPFLVKTAQYISRCNASEWLAIVWAVIILSLNRMHISMTECESPNEMFMDGRDVVGYFGAEVKLHLSMCPIVKVWKHQIFGVNIIKNSMIKCKWPITMR